MRRSATYALCCLALASCGAWPDLPSDAQRDPGGPWPVLKPSSELYAAAAPQTADDAVAETLNARAEALRRRAALLRTPVGDDGAFEALRERIDG